MKIKIKYKSFVAMLFFIFFATPILSPAINNNTIYLHWFIPLLDFKFVNSILKMKISKKYIYSIFLGILILLLFKKVMTAIKVIFLIETLLYLFYCKKEKMFSFLYLATNLNIIIAIVQFVLYYISPSAARAIGPDNIAGLIWGEYATSSFTNFFPIFRFVRVCGWSREAGFFASLIIIVFIIYIKDCEKTKESKIQYLLFLIAYIISFSKISLILIPVMIVVLFEKQIKRVPYIFGVIGSIIIMIISSNYLKYNGFYTESNESIIHRIAGYSILTELDVKEIIFGVDKIEDMNESLLKRNSYLQYVYWCEQFCGIPNIMVHYGMIIFILFIISLGLIGVTTTEFLILTVMTLNVEYFTATSFVVLSYFLCLNMIQKRNDKSIKYDLIYEERREMK